MLTNANSTKFTGLLEVVNFSKRGAIVSDENGSQLFLSHEEIDSRFLPFTHTSKSGDPREDRVILLPA